jgi:hypothetical protein
MYASGNSPARSSCASVAASTGVGLQPRRGDRPGAQRMRQMQLKTGVPEQVG